MAKEPEQEKTSELAEKKDPPYLAELLEYHPELTREEALEMIKEAGG